MDQDLNRSNYSTNENDVDSSFELEDFREYEEHYSDVGSDNDEFVRPNNIDDCKCRRNSIFLHFDRIAHTLSIIALSESYRSIQTRSRGLCGIHEPNVSAADVSENENEDRSFNGNSSNMSNDDASHGDISATTVTEVGQKRKLSLEDRGSCQYRYFTELFESIL